MDYRNSFIMPRLIPRILRVNHAGAHGAVAIYAAQLPPSR
jgi:demethoxyubiquinone hydroxylase (CLK1/Coq7/Cat5 family)